MLDRSPGFDLKFGIVAAVVTVKGLELVLKKQNKSSSSVNCSFCASVCCPKKARVLHSISCNSLHSFGQRFPQSDSECKKVPQQKQNKYKMSKQIKDKAHLSLSNLCLVIKEKEYKNIKEKEKNLPIAPGGARTPDLRIT